MSQFGQSCLLAVCLLVLGLQSGCGSNSEAPVDGNTTVPNENAAGSVTKISSSTNNGSTGGAEPQTRRQNERWTDDNGVEYLGDVPLDVFFDEPLKVARNQTLLQNGGPGTGAAVSGGSMEAPDPSADTSPAEADPPASDSAVAWDSLLSIDTLQEEVKNVRNFLNRSIQSYGDYKKVTLMIPGKAASIAVLASVAMQHPEEVNWKPDAIYIRDLARQMNEQPLQANKKDHGRVLELFENIASTLDRSRPSGLAEPNPEDSFVDVAGMDMVMVRLDEAEKRLKTEAGSQSAFDSKKDMINHEAAILATFSHVVTIEGYGYADDEEFTGYANQIVQAAQRIQTATEANDFDTYELALSKVSTSCSDCHSAYRNN